MKIYPLTEARKILGELINQVKYQRKMIGIGKHGSADVLMVAFPKNEQHDDLPITDINMQSESFAFLQDEPDLYSVDDLQKKYV